MTRHHRHYREGGRDQEPYEYGWDPISIPGAALPPVPVDIPIPAPAPSPPGSLVSFTPPHRDHADHSDSKSRSRSRSKSSRRRGFSPTPSTTPPNPRPVSRRSVTGRSMIGMPTAATVIGSGYREKGWDYDEADTPRTPRQRHRDFEKGGYFEDRGTANLKSRWDRTSQLHSAVLIPPPSSGYRHARSRSLSISRTSPSSSVSSSPEFFGIGGFPPIRTSEHRHRKDNKHHNHHAPSKKHHPRSSQPQHWYQHDVASHSSPRVALAEAGWPLTTSRPVSRSPPTHEPYVQEYSRYGHHGSAGQNGSREYRPQHFGGYVAVDNLHHFPEKNDLRMGLQRMGLASTSALTEPNTNRTRRKVTGTARKRSESSSRVAETDDGVRERLPPTGQQYKEVHCLILTWSFHDLRAEDYMAPPAADYISLEDESERLIKTLKNYGWQVSEHHIDMNRPVESTTARLNKFCQLASDDVLLVVYYHGHGSLDEDNELVFSSHDHPENSEWAKKAAADLYSELLSRQNGGHGQNKAAFEALMKKYERYRPISHLPWSTLRQPLLTCPSDVLFILDCCAAGGANLPSSSIPQSNTYTKHLFAACGFESSTSDDMTATLCNILDDNAAQGANKTVLTTKRLHQLIEESLQKKNNGVGTSQPIFKQLLPLDPERKIHLPNLGNHPKGRGRRSRRESQSHANMKMVAVNRRGSEESMNGMMVHGVHHGMGMVRREGSVRGYVLA
ncbi:hypothetical protein QC761_700740 [Podospora bellae-mahoneyi]|uniref:Caspase domain-containing protein n=1 Tax=Podospora bellae-mahoneyi TaxID=2093777 RepID=A0ABR0F889_9PEZI|nr:hypothetical protein QC761_700740 [Podospora bellae-mahoneyi]